MLYVLRIHVTMSYYRKSSLASKMIGSFYFARFYLYTASLIEHQSDPHLPVVWASGVLFSASRTPLEWARGYPKTFSNSTNVGTARNTKSDLAVTIWGQNSERTCSWYRYKILPSSNENISTKLATDLARSWRNISPIAATQCLAPNHLRPTMNILGELTPQLTAAYLRTLPAIRERCSRVHDLATQGKLQFFDYHPEREAEVAAFCLNIIKVCMTIMRPWSSFTEPEGL